MQDHSSLFITEAAWTPSTAPGTKAAAPQPLAKKQGRLSANAGHLGYWYIVKGGLNMTCTTKQIWDENANKSQKKNQEEREEFILITPRPDKMDQGILEYKDFHSP